MGYKNIETLIGLCMNTGIYGLFDKQNGQCLYVGLTSRSFNARYNQHLYLLRKGKHKRADFVEWFKLHGENNLELKILEKCEPDPKTLNKKEIYWFNELKPQFYGKQPSENETWEHSDKTRQKISETSRKTSKKDSANNLKTCIVCYKYFISKRRKTCSNDCLKIFKQTNSVAIPNDAVNEIKDLYLSGKSLNDLAKIFNVCHRTVLLFMEKHNIPRRSASESISLALRDNEFKTRVYAKKVCENCGKSIGVNNFGRHETACRSKPKCGCGKILSKVSAKSCRNCLDFNKSFAAME